MASIGRAIDGRMQSMFEKAVCNGKGFGCALQRTASPLNT
jgi:hypothetical protein